MSGIDWPGLLKWSLNYQDGTTDSDVKPMSDEKKEFLSLALEKFYGGIKDPHEACKEALESLNPNNVDATMGALQVVRDLTVETPELARNFAKISAAQKLHSCLLIKSEYGIPVVTLAVRILGEVSQNNPALQKALVELGAIRTLCEILKETSEKMISLKQDIAKGTDESVKNEKIQLQSAYREKRQRSMVCVSNIIRHDKKAEEIFANLGGLSWIKYALQQDDTKFMETSLLLLFHLLAERTISASSLIKLERGSKKSFLKILNRKMVHHDTSGGPHLGELFIQTFQALWESGGTELPTEMKREVLETLTQKIGIVEALMAAEAAKPDNEFKDDFQGEYDSLLLLRNQIEAALNTTN